MGFVSTFTFFPVFKEGSVSDLYLIYDIEIHIDMKINSTAYGVKLDREILLQMHIRGWTIQFANFDIRGIVHYEFVPTGQSAKFTIWKY